MLTKKTVTTTTTFFDVEYPACKGELNEQEALDLLEALADAFQDEPETVEPPYLLEEEESFEEDAELPGAQN